MSRRVLSWQCLLLTVLAVLLQGTVGRKVISLYCPDFSQHPSILDALQAALPHVDMSELISAEAMGAIPQDMPEALQTFSRVVSNVLQQRLYLTSWVSDAQYTVHFNESIDSLSFQDVFVVQENHFKFNALCQVLPLGIPYLSSLCHCSSTMQFQHSVWIQKQLPVHDLEEEVDKSRWCVRKARCTSNDMQIGKCHVHVDPIRRSCLILQHDELEVSQHWQQVNTVTAYEEKVPKLVNVLPTGWKKKFYHPYHKQAKQFVVDALSYIPYYLFNLCMGMFIMYYASDFAEDAVFHFFLEAFIGVFFALFILAFLGKK